MRFLLGLVFCVALAPAVSAQQVRLKLQDGRLVVGQLIAVTDDTIEIQVGEEVVRVGVNEVAEFSEVAADPKRETPPTDPPSTDLPAIDPPVTTPLPTVLEDPPATGQDPPPAPGGAAPTVTPPTRPSATSSTRRSRTMYAERLGWIPERYTWITPEHTPSLVSMLVLLLFVVGTSIHLGTRVANVEFRSFGRSCLMSLVVIVAAGIQIGFVPISPVSLACMVLGNTVAWMALSAGLFQAPRFASLTTAVVTVLCVLVSFMLLELVDSLIGMVNGGIAREW